jgi:manganese transport protein
MQLQIIVNNPEMRYLALGIIGATVMPHNLYLHSGVVQTRAYGRSVRSSLPLSIRPSR